MPSSPLGVLLSLADKFDNLICSFLLGKKPSASHDPQGIRRQSIYIIEIITQNEIHLNMNPFLFDVLSLYEHFFKVPLRSYLAKKEELREKIWSFLRGRFSTVFEKQGFDRKLIRAGLYTQGDNIHILNQKLLSLRKLKNKEDFVDLIAGFKRMDNIIGDFLKKNKLPASKIDVSLFEDQEERELFNFLKGIRGLY